MAAGPRGRRQAIATDLRASLHSDYRAAYQAWLKTDPFTNPAAPTGPALMSSYHNPNQDKANRLNALAAATFDHGTRARDTAEKYVRNTVLFAAVLFLIAVAQ